MYSSTVHSSSSRWVPLGTFEVLATSLRLRLGHECGTFGGAGG